MTNTTSTAPTDANIAFSASQSNTIYSGSTVQPAAAQTLMIIKV